MEAQTGMALNDTTVQILAHVPIALSDGCVLSARLWRPETADALPAVLEIHPYPKRYSTATRDEINHGWFARHGYVSLRVDSRGAGDSQGYIADEYQPQEHSDLLEVIAWIADQEWCNGNVGMFGHSWGAYSGLQMAARDVPALKAVAVSGASDDLYAEDCHFRGGVMASEHFGWAATMLSFFSRPPDPEMTGQGWREVWMDRLDHIEWVLPEWLRHPTRDAHWKYPSICENYSAVTVPVLAASGWADVYATSVMRMAEHMPHHFKGVIGPWAHKFPHMGLPKPAIGWLQECVKWWDHWLKGIDNDVENLPRLRVFIPEKVKPETHSDNHREGRWIGETRSPSRNVEAKEFRFSRGRLGGESQNVALQVCSPNTLGVAGGELMPMGWGADLPDDQRFDDERSLVFETVPLNDPVDVLGETEVNLTFSSDKPVAFVVARLCDVAPDGSSTRICYGAVNLTHDATHENVEPLQPGKVYRVKLRLDATAYRFCSGHRIRLALSTTYWPLLWPAPEPATLTIYTEDCAMLLPELKQNDAVEPAFDAPDGATPERTTILEKARFERTFEEGREGGKATYRIVDHAAKERHDANGLITWGSTERVYRINNEDPASCTMHSTRNIFVEDKERIMHTRVVADMSCSKTDFFVTARLTAWDSNEMIFDRIWDDTIPRHGN